MPRFPISLRRAHWEEILRLLTLLIILTGVSWLVLSHAWFSDDAYFSFRTVDNFVNGYGLTWNVSERVQVYTHPLWVLLLSPLYALTGEIYLTTIFMSLALTLALALIIYLAIADKPAHGILAVFFLSLSTAFIDYSSPGLENPLSHLLLVVFLWALFRRIPLNKKLFWLSLIASLAAVNRLDTLLFYFPVLVYEFWLLPDKRAAAKMLILGLIPLIVWEAFSMLYYGFPFPNTFYAKTQNFIPLSELFFWGMNYFKFTAIFDPVTWLGIAVGLTAPFLVRDRRGISVAAGVILYLIYVLSIGGDFMGGRFLSTAYLATVVLILVFLLPNWKPITYPLVIIVPLILSLAGTSPPYHLYPKDFQKTRLPLTGNIVVDERREFYTTNFVRLEDFYEFNSDPNHSIINNLAFLVRSVFRGTAFRTEVEHDWVEIGVEFRRRAEADGPFVTEEAANGFTGYYAGPDVHFIQTLALTDAFLARLPPIYAPNWRSAHFTRVLPDGYREFEKGLQPHLTDKELDNYFQKLQLVIRGDLFSIERLNAILDLNVSSFSSLFPDRVDQFRFPRLLHVNYQDQLDANSDFTRVDFSHCCGIALQLDFATPVHADIVELKLSSGDNFEVLFLNSSGKRIAAQVLIADSPSQNQTFRVHVPEGIATTGYSAIRLIPIRVNYQVADATYHFYGARLLD